MPETSEPMPPKLAKPLDSIPANPLPEESSLPRLAQLKPLLLEVGLRAWELEGFPKVKPADGLKPDILVRLLPEKTPVVSFARPPVNVSLFFLVAIPSSFALPYELNFLLPLILDYRDCLYGSRRHAPDIGAPEAFPNLELLNEPEAFARDHRFRALLCTYATSSPNCRPIRRRIVIVKAAMSNSHQTAFPA
jgi:hypothetical protein